MRRQNMADFFMWMTFIGLSLMVIGLMGVLFFG